MIRPLVTDDAELLAALYAANRKAYRPFWPDLPEEYCTTAGQRDRIRAATHAYAIVEDGVLLGTITLSNLARGPFQSASLGYWVDRGHTGHGVATRAVGEIIVEAFSNLRLHRVEAATLVDNLASQRVLAKNEFTPIGLAPRYLRIDGEWRDHLLFQRTVED